MELRSIRYHDDKAPSGLSIGSITPNFEKIAEANVPMLLCTGWLDATVTSNLRLFHMCKENPCIRMLIGPWNHACKFNMALHRSTSARTQVDLERYQSMKHPTPPAFCM